MNRNRILYLGLEVPDTLKRENVFHCPLIRIVPRNMTPDDIQKAFSQIKRYTHLVFTSQNAVIIFFRLLTDFGYNLKDVEDLTCFAVGKKTADSILKICPKIQVNIASEENAEGLIAKMQEHDLKKSYLLWPHSALSRPILRQYFEQNAISFCECILYDTVPNESAILPDLNQIDEIVFTSPSTVEAFLQRIPDIPVHIKLTPIGKITADALWTKILKEKGDNQYQRYLQYV